jgi:hypothetical protein
MKPTRPTDNELGGMTVNERLVLCDLLDNWDAAVGKRDREEMIAILCQVALTQELAAYTTDTVLKNPAKYGL